MDGPMHHVESSPGLMDLTLIVKEQILAAEGSVYQQKIRGSLNMQRTVHTGSITTASLSTCLSDNFPDSLQRLSGVLTGIESSRRFVPLLRESTPLPRMTFVSLPNLKFEGSKMLLS